MISVDEITTPQPVARRRELWRTPGLVAAATFAALAVGGGFVSYSFHLAASTGASSPMFAFFWAGMLLALLPLATLASSSYVMPWVRVLAVAGVGAVTTFPKMLRSPVEPLFHDEYAHLRQVNDILTQGAPGDYNSIVTVSPNFPGLHYVTAWVSEATGLNAWLAGLVLICAAHIVGLLSLYWLARNMGLSSRGAAVAAIVYATNANWMYFHSQFAYESLGLPAALLVLAATSWALLRLPRETVWLALPVLLPVGYLVATVHHLSALGMLALMLAMALSATVLSPSRSLALATWAAFAALFVGVAVRLWSVSGLLVDYLGSPITRGSGQLSNVVMEALGLQTGSAERLVLFDNSVIPGYERLAGFLVPVIFGGMVLAYLWLWIQQRREDLPRYLLPEGPPMRAGLMWFGAFYFLSLPFLLAAGGNEGGRRSWAYSLIGLSIIAGILIDALSSRKKSGKLGRPIAVCGIGVWIVLLVGGVATGVNAEYRFPLKPVGVSDLTAASAETQALGRWFRDNVEPNTWVLADRYASMTVAGEGRAQIVPASVALPYWELYFLEASPATRTVAALYAIGAEYAVVDKRMAEATPRNGYWLSPTEPQPEPGSASTTLSALDKFNYLPWMTAVYGSENYTVYRLDLDRYNPYATDRLIQEAQP